MARLLITGGAGFIGTHSCVVLIEDGHDLVVIDSLTNSSPIGLKRVIEITGLKAEEANQRLQFIKGDVRDKSILDKIFSTASKKGKRIDAVIHFAGLKSVNKSLKEPLNYWDVNVNGTCCLLTSMNEHNCKTLIFSSSATIYGKPVSLPIEETAEIKPINPYGNTKATVEKMLADMSNLNTGWRIASLRYFNPIGAHPSGLIGEEPREEAANLLPLVGKVLVGRQKKLRIFGNDWPTSDGTCIRDYIHVMDLAKGHSAALNFLLKKEDKFLTLNLGTGKGHSVMEVVKSFEMATGENIPYVIANRRPGDVAVTIADPSQAQKTLNWNASQSLVDSCKDLWTWQSSNPNGYEI